MIRFKNVGLRYELGSEVLSDISFTISPGSFQFLTGPSGSGKTSLLRLMFLSQKPTRGMIFWSGKDVFLLKRNEIAQLRKRIGIVFQDFRLLDHLTVYENVSLPLYIRGQWKDEDRAAVKELLCWVGLENHMHVFPPILSGGEKQRVAIARALIDKPDILLADEPTGNVDPILAGRLLRLFVELNRLGTAIVIATHDTSLMDRVDAHRMILQNGRLSLHD